MVLRGCLAGVCRIAMRDWWPGVGVGGGGRGLELRTGSQGVVGRVCVCVGSGGFQHHSDSQCARL